MTVKTSLSVTMSVAFLLFVSLIVLVRASDQLACTEFSALDTDEYW